MSAYTDPIPLLRRIADGSETAADRAALGDRLRTYLSAAPNGGSLDDAFGLTPKPGQLSWWRAEALATRDAALRALADSFHAGLPTARQAEAIHDALLAYATSTWRFDRARDAPPAHYLGRPHEMMFDALRADPTVPGVRHLRRILGG